MPDYDEYIKCGEVLLSPSLTDKDQFILKCGDCDQYYCDLQRFIPHWQSHYEVEDFNESEFEVEEIYKEEHDPANEDEQTFHELEKSIANEVIKEELEEPISKTEVEYLIECQNDVDMEEESTPYLDDVEFFIESSEYEDRKPKDEKSVIENDSESEKLEDTDDYRDDSNEIDSDHSTEEDVQPESNPLEEENEDEESTGKRKRNAARGNKFIHGFFNSKRNVSTFIEAYKKQKNLWEIGVSNQLSTQQRIKYLEEIAKEVEEKVNVKLTLDQIRETITYLRSRQRIALKRADNPNKPEPEWFVEHLKFLPSPYSATIDELGSYILKRAQIIQILRIYEKLPHLWNTDLVEYVCNNKRDEALQEMQRVLQAKMKLKTEISDLRRYIHDINTFCTKTKILSKKKSKHDKVSEYYFHMQYLCDHVGPFECEQCHKKSGYAIAFKIHINGHNGGEGIECKICGKPYNNAEAYIRHCRRHMDDLSVECKECGKRFMRDADLREHMRIHTGIKPYCCEICGASFRHNNAFVLHTRRHNKEYCYSCSVCPRQFFSKDALNNHMDIHKEVRDRICKICGKGFKTKSTLKAHTMTHETELKHPCELCGKLFKNRLGIYHHMKTHRRKEPQENIV